MRNDLQNCYFSGWEISLCQVRFLAFPHGWQIACIHENIPEYHGALGLNWFLTKCLMNCQKWTNCSTWNSGREHFAAWNHLAQRLPQKKKFFLASLTCILSVPFVMTSVLRRFYFLGFSVWGCIIEHVFVASRTRTAARANPVRVTRCISAMVRVSQLMGWLLPEFPRKSSLCIFEKVMNFIGPNL